MSILPQRIDVMNLSLSVLTFRFFFFFFGGGGGEAGRQARGEDLIDRAPQWCLFCQYMPQGGDVLLWIRKL